MPVPSTTLTKLNPDLDTFYEFEYELMAGNYIGTRVLPIFQTQLQSGSFGKVTLESLLEHSTGTNRAPTSGYYRRQLEFTDDTYATQEHGLEELMDDREVAMYGNFFDATALATARAVNSILTAHEIRVANAVMDTGFYTGAYAQALGNGTWNGAASTPLADIEAAWRKHRTNTGMAPNALIINEIAFRTLREHPDVIARVEAAGSGDQARARDVNLAQLSAVLDIDRIIVGGSMQNSANPAAAASLADVWPKHALICRVAETNDMREPCLGRTFHWAGDGSSEGGRIETYREEATRSTVVRVRHETDEKLIRQELGVMILNCIP